MGILKKCAVALVLALTVGVGIAVANPTSASASAQSCTFSCTTISPSVFARNSPATAFTVEIAGNGPVGGTATWYSATISLGSVSQPWVFPSTCPTTSATSTTTWANCGVAGILRDGTSVLPLTKIWQSAVNTLSFDFQSQVSTSSGYFAVAFIANALQTADQVGSSPVIATLHTSTTVPNLPTASATLNSVVTFDPNGGTGTMADQLGYSSTALNSNTFTRTNFSFAGWSTTPTGSVAYADGASYSFANSTTLYAQWTAYPAVTFDPNGGSGTMANQSSLTPTALTTNTFTRTNYSFAGWSTTQAGTGGTAYADGATFPFANSATTLYAQWTAYPTVTFNTNGGTGGTTTQQANNPTPLNPNSSTFAGCTFTGWNTAADGTGTSYSAGATFTFANSVTLYAQWMGTDGQACSAALGNPASRAAAASAAAQAAAQLSASARLASTGFAVLAPVGVAALLVGMGLLILTLRRKARS